MTARIAKRRDEIFDSLHYSVCVETDRLFAVLFGVQWVLGMVAAFKLSPLAWSGTSSQIHVHVWAAFGLGGAIVALPILLALRQPGRASTRHAIAVGQMLFGALLIHLCGGRIETHFHVFGSLAFLAFYRDWRVLVSATLVVVVDHAVRGLLFPQSIYGVLTPDAWRLLEHAGWVAFEDTVLVAGCLRGIRELRRMAQHRAECEASEERYRAVVGQLADGILVFDAETLKILEFNPAFERYAGATCEQLMGMKLRKSMVGGDPDISVADEVDQLLRSGLPTVTDRVLQAMDLNTVEVSCSMGPTTYAGRPAVCAVIRDVSARNRVQAEIAEARDAAVASAKLRSEFLANMSHEIRTPLNGVIGMASLLLDTTMTRHQRELAETVVSSAESLVRVIDDILEFSKMESGKLQFEAADFNLRQLVESTLDQFAERALAKGLELVSLIDAGVPDVVTGDPGRLRQVLVNLIGNALKFTHRGEVVVAVSALPTTSGEACLRFEIRDSGIGISDEARGRLFSAFSQADGSTTRQYGGTGLGLAISKRLVAMFHGEIGFDSIVDTGTTFWFTVRCVLPPSAIVPLAQVPVWAGSRVLVVDDSPAVRQSVAATLSSWGVEVVAVHGAPRALSALRDAHDTGRPFAVAIVDQHMPGIDGLHLVRSIRAEAAIAGVRIILMTPFGVPEDSGAIRAEGILEALAKPLKPHRLREALDHVMAPAPATAASQGRAEKRPPPPIPARVLVAEDNTVNQRVALLQLQRLGCTADAVENGVLAVAALQREHYDLVLMDCQMPELDGYDATRQIRRLPSPYRDVPIIALTAHALNGDREKCLAAGMTDYLSKPLKMTDLQAALERWFVAKRECA